MYIIKIEPMYDGPFSTQLLFPCAYYVTLLFYGNSTLNTSDCCLYSSTINLFYLLSSSVSMSVDIRLTTTMISDKVSSIAPHCVYSLSRLPHHTHE